jgi:hypothetical protein
MTSSQAVELARLNAELEAARPNIKAMQPVLRRLTNFYRRVYGRMA